MITQAIVASNMTPRATPTEAPTSVARFSGQVVADGVGMVKMLADVDRLAMEELELDEVAERRSDDNRVDDSATGSFGDRSWSKMGPSFIGKVLLPSSQQLASAVITSFLPQQQYSPFVQGTSAKFMNSESTTHQLFVYIDSPEESCDPSSSLGDCMCLSLLPFPQ